MCRSTAGPLLAIVGMAGTAAGVAVAIVRERIDRLADARAARQASEEQDAREVVRRDSGGGTTGATDNKPVEFESDETR